MKIALKYWNMALKVTSDQETYLSERIKSFNEALSS